MPCQDGKRGWPPGPGHPFEVPFYRGQGKTCLNFLTKIAADEKGSMIHRFSLSDGAADGSGSTSYLEPTLPNRMAAGRNLGRLEGLLNKTGGRGLIESLFYRICRYENNRIVLLTEVAITDFGTDKLGKSMLIL